MATSKKPQAEKAPEPQQNDAGSTAAPAVDPGPPPPFPAPPGAGPLLDRLYLTGRERNREGVLAVQTLSQGPQVSRYKAEVLAWLDAMDAYEA